MPCSESIQCDFFNFCAAHAANVMEFNGLLMNRGGDAMARAAMYGKLSMENTRLNFLSVIHQIKRLGVLPPWAAQRALVSTQACYPTTVRAGRFSLLCFQPEAMLVSVAARTCQLPSAHPCRAPTWQGHAINMRRRPCAVR